MTVSLVLGRKAIGSIGELVLDARIDENHQLSNDVTQYPVEEGSNITDHVRNRPFVLTMTGHVTDSPIEYFDLSEDLNNQEGETRSRSAFDQLITLYNDKSLVDVQTTLNLYQNMVIQDLIIPRNSSIGQELRFTATLIQITKTRTEFASVNVANVSDINGGAPDIDKRAAANADKGKQTGKEPSKSLGAAFVDFIGRK